MTDKIKHELPRAFADIVNVDVNPKLSSALMVPPGYRMVIREAEKVPENTTQSVRAERLEDLLGYCSRMVTEPAKLAIYISRTSVKAFLDASLPGGVAGRMGHQVEWGMAYSDDMKALNAALGKELSQVDFCLLIERLESCWGNGAALLDLVQFFDANESIKVVSRKSITGYTGTVMEYSNTIAENSGALKIPKTLVATLPIYTGLAPVGVRLVLSWKIKEGKPVFLLRCPELETIERDQLKEIETMVNDWVAVMMKEEGETPRWTDAPLVIQGMLVAYDCAKPGAEVTHNGGSIN